MLKNDFLTFYTATIKHYGDKFVNDNPAYTFVDQPGRIYEEYLNQKTLMRLLMEKNHSAQLLDRHKVCAAMTVAILKCRPIIKDDIEDVDGTFNLSEASKINEQIAFYSSWSLLIAFIVSEKNAKETENRKFILPPTNHNTDFGDTFSRSLFFANIQNSLSPELLANIYFLLESYNKLNEDIQKLKEQIQ